MLVFPLESRQHLAGSALFVVASPTALNSSESQIVASLKGHGLDVAVADDNAVQASHADGKSLVVISKTVTSTNIGTKLNNVKAGIVFWEDNLQDELAGVRGEQSHYTSDRFDIDPDGVGHPLAAGFAARDDLVFYTNRNSGTDFSWGEPSRSNYVVVAANEKGSHDVHIYGIDAGDRMDDGRTAPGRRVFFGLYDNSFRYLTADGLKLWSAAVNWANTPVTEDPPLPPNPDPDPPEDDPRAVTGFTLTDRTGTIAHEVISEGEVIYLDQLPAGPWNIRADGTPDKVWVIGELFLDGSLTDRFREHDDPFDFRARGYVEGDYIATAWLEGAKATTFHETSFRMEAVTPGEPDEPDQPGNDNDDRPQRPASVGPVLTITKGGTYTGNFAGIVMKTSEPVLIQNSNLVGKTDLITSSVSGARITLRNVNGWSENPNVYDKSPGRFLYAFNFKSIDVEGCYMESTRGIVLNGNKAGGTVRIVGNSALNIDGRLSDGNGGWRGGGVHNRAQFINLDKVQNVPGVEIAWNEVINEPGKSRVEDNIALYQSSGTASSPIRVHDNYVQGGYNADPANDGAYAGGGILLGDGHTGSAYAEAYNNVVVSTTNYGIAISGGHHQRIYNNRVLSSGLLPDGRRIAAQNVGIYIWDYHKAGSGFNNNSGSGNHVGWVRADGKRNDWWVPDAASWTGNTRWPDPLTLAAEQAEYEAWKGRRQ